MKKLISLILLTGTLVVASDDAAVSTAALGAQIGSNLNSILAERQSLRDQLSLAQTTMHSQQDEITALRQLVKTERETGQHLVATEKAATKALLEKSLRETIETLNTQKAAEVAAAITATHSEEGQARKTLTEAMADLEKRHNTQRETWKAEQFAKTNIIESLRKDVAKVTQEKQTAEATTQSLRSMIDAMAVKYSALEHEHTLAKKALDLALQINSASHETDESARVELALQTEPGSDEGKTN